MASLRDQLSEEPYRIFFPLGILLALGGVGHWLFYSMGWMPYYHGFLHARIQSQLYLTCAASGFLMTAIPRFSGTAPAKSWELMLFLGSVLGITITLFFGQWVASQVFYILWLLSLGFFIASRFVKRQVQYPPAEFVWIAPAILMGSAGASIIILSLKGGLGPEWMAVGRSMQEQGFMLALVLGIGGFLGPRLMGVSPFPTAPLPDLQTHFERKLAVNAIGAFVLIASFLLECREDPGPAHMLRALVVAAMLFRTRALNGKILTGPSLFVRLLSGSFWMITVGYWLLPVFPVVRVPLLHFVFLGGFSLMIFCVSTMVVLNHSGHGDDLHRPLWIIRLIGVGVLLSLTLRFLATFSPSNYFIILGISSGLWLMVGTAWLIFSYPYIFGRLRGRSGEPHEAC